MIWWWYAGIVIHLIAMSMSWSLLSDPAGNQPARRAKVWAIADMTWHASLQIASKSELVALHPFMHLCMHSLTHLFVCSFIHPFNNSFTCSFVPSSIGSFFLSFIQSFIRSFSPSFTHSVTHSFIHSFIHWQICWFIHSFIHPFIHHVNLFPQGHIQTVTENGSHSTEWKGANKVRHSGRKDYAFWHQINEMTRMIPDCPGIRHSPFLKQGNGGFWVRPHVIGQHLHAQQLQTLCIGLDILDRLEGQVQGVHMGHHAHCKSCHSEAFAVPVLNDLHVSQAPLRLAFPVHSLQVVDIKKVQSSLQKACIILSILLW